MAALDDFLSFLQGASNSAASAVSAPVDGINWALGKVGVQVSKKPVGGSEWLKELGFTAEPKNKTAGLLGEAVGGVLPIVAQAKAPQIAAGINQMVANAQAPRTLNPQTGAIVWHGSPHKFDKFDSSKIGTGEGAQAYGHGLYLAEAPEVAGEYAKNLSARKAAYKVSDGRTLQFDDDLSIMLDDVVNKGGKLEDWIRLSSDEAKDPMLKRASELAKTLVGKKIEQATNPGALYKVDLPDDAIAKMLDWDKPLSQQAPEVQKAVSNTELSDLLSRGQTALKKAGFARAYGTGDDIYDDLIGLAESRGVKNTKAFASDYLRQLGIPGIRYLDGGSRGVGQGTSNFVVFPGNEGLLTILERNGQRLP